MRMRASTCDVASRTSFDSGGDEDGREPVLRDQAERAAHGAAHRGNGGMGCLRVERKGWGCGVRCIVGYNTVRCNNKVTILRRASVAVTVGRYNMHQLQLHTTIK